MPTGVIQGIDDNSWEHLLDSLEEEKCVLCVGPGLYSQEEGPRPETQLADFLREKEQEIRIRVYDDGWFHYLPDASEIDAWQRVKEFYQRPNQSTLSTLELLSEIPFYLLLNFTPSYALREVFEEKGFSHNFLSFIKKQPFNPELEANRFKPTARKPLIYNMLGEVKKRNSLVMTYSDFYAYLESIFEGNSMAPSLQENIWEADYFIFLGMPFDRWYVHMFMRILQQHERNRSSKKYAANLYLSGETTTHCAEQYTMTFVPSGITQFLETFHKKCRERGQLRSVQQNAEFQLPMDEVTTWLRRNEFQQIFDLLFVQLNKIGAVGDSWKKEVIQLDARYNDLKRNIRLNIIDERDRVIEVNRLRVNIMDTVDSMNKALSSKA